MDNLIIKLIHKDVDKGMSCLIENYSGLVYTIINNRISQYCSPQDIEEAVSDVFISFYNSIDKVDLNKGSLRAYLSSLAKRKAVDKYRSISGKNEISSDDDFFIEVPDNFNLESEVEKRELRHKLICEINNLGEPDTTIVYRKYFLGESSKRIAEHTNLTENNVRQRLMRALKKLNASMKGEHYEG